MPTLGAVLEVSDPMSDPRARPPPSQPWQPSEAQPRPISSLYKQHSWSPDAYRDEAWLRRKGNSKNRRSKSVTDEDLDELKACIELGFGFDDSLSPELDQRLSDTLPALGLYYAVNKQYNDTVSKPTTTTPPSSTPSECDSAPSPLGSPHTTIFSPGKYIYIYIYCVN
jgi:hypothetical protein